METKERVCHGLMAHPFFCFYLADLQSALSVFTMMSVLHLLYKEEKKQGQDKMNQFEPIFRIST